MLVVRGMSEPDTLKKVAVVHNLLNGDTAETVLGFRKEVSMQFRPFVDPSATRFLVRWLLAESKRIKTETLLSEGIVDESLASTWLADLEHGRTFELTFYDQHVYQRWEDAGASADYLMYFKRDVKITGTWESPEVFTTNTGKLALMENGHPFPVFNSTTHDFLVALNAEKGCQATFGVVKGSVAVVSGNLTFNAFVSDYGAPADDGFFWCAIAIFLQEK